MTEKTLRRVTLDTLENYQTAATQAVKAYRLGGHRLVRGLDSALQERVYPRTARFAPLATERADEMRGNVSEFVVKGIDQVADTTEKVIEFGSTRAAAQVTRVAGFATGIENPTLASGVQVAARVAMPGAKLALVVSGKVAEGAQALADAAGARRVRKAVSKAAEKAAPIRRKAGAMAKTTRRRVAEVTKAPVAKARRAVAQATQ